MSYKVSDDARGFISEFSRTMHNQAEGADEILSEYSQNYRKAYSQLGQFQVEAYKDEGMYLGNQWDNREKKYLYDQRRSANTYNKTKRIVDLVDGYQRKNRLSMIVSPVDDSADQVAEVYTNAIMSVMNKNSGYEVVSDASKAALTTGIAFVSPWCDYRDDPVNSDIKLHLDNWNAVMFDPFFTKRDLSDCTYFIRRKYLSKSAAASLVPDKYDDIMRMSPSVKDDKFTWMPYARQAGQENLLDFSEYWRSKYIMKDVLVDMNTGLSMEYKGPRERLLLIQEMHPQLQIMRKPTRTVELGIIIQGQLMFFGDDPNGISDYPFVPFFYNFNPSYDLWQYKLFSMVRVIRDSQIEINKRRSKMLDILDSQLNSGWIAKTGSVTNNSQLFSAGQAQVVFLRPEAQMSDIQRLDPPDIPAGQFQLEQYFNQDMVENAGVNQELFGMADEKDVQTSGILSKMRQSAGLVNLQGYFDGLRDSQQILGQKILKFIQNCYSPEKIALITGKEVPPDFYSSQYAKYKVVVEEGVLTSTQREMQFLQLVALKQMGILPDSVNSLIIKNSNLHNHRELEEILDAQAKQEQEFTQAQAAQETENQQVLNMTLLSKSESDQALAKERVASIGLKNAENAERISRAVEDRSSAELNLIKALKELEGIDLSLMAQKLAMIKQLGEMQEQESAAKRNAIMQEAQNIGAGQTEPIQQMIQ